MLGFMKDNVNLSCTVQWIIKCLHVKSLDAILFSSTFMIEGVPGAQGFNCNDVLRIIILHATVPQLYFLVTFFSTSTVSQLSSFGHYLGTDGQCFWLHWSHIRDGKLQGPPHFSRQVTFLFSSISLLLCLKSNCL